MLLLNAGHDSYDFSILALVQDESQAHPLHCCLCFGAKCHLSSIFSSRWYFAVISVSGVFAVTFSVIFAYVADITQEHERSTAYGLVGSLTGYSSLTVHTLQVHQIGLALHRIQRPSSAWNVNSMPNFSAKIGFQNPYKQ